eukprot:5417724-Pleurochrysis_carterae.AAC.1
MFTFFACKGARDRTFRRGVRRSARARAIGKLGARAGPEGEAQKLTAGRDLRLRKRRHSQGHARLLQW